MQFFFFFFIIYAVSGLWLQETVQKANGLKTRLACPLLDNLKAEFSDRQHPYSDVPVCQDYVFHSEEGFSVSSLRIEAPTHCGAEELPSGLLFMSDHRPGLREEFDGFTAESFKEHNIGACGGLQRAEPKHAVFFDAKRMLARRSLSATLPTLGDAPFKGKYLHLKFTGPARCHMSFGVKIDGKHDGTVRNKKPTIPVHQTPSYPCAGCPGLY